MVRDGSVMVLLIVADDGSSMDICIGPPNPADGDEDCADMMAETTWVLVCSRLCRASVGVGATYGQ